MAEIDRTALNQYLNSIKDLDYDTDYIAEKNLELLQSLLGRFDLEEKAMNDDFTQKIWKKMKTKTPRSLLTLWKREEFSLSGIKKTKRVFLAEDTANLVLGLKGFFVKELLMPPSGICQMDFLDLVESVNGFDAEEKKARRLFFSPTKTLLILNNIPRIERYPSDFRKNQAMTLVNFIQNHLASYPNIGFLGVRSELPMLGETDNNPWLSFLDNKFELEKTPEN